MIREMVGEYGCERELAEIRKQAGDERMMDRLVKERKKAMNEISSLGRKTRICM